MKSSIPIGIVMSVFLMCVPQINATPIAGPSLSVEDSNYPNTVGGLNNAAIGYGHNLAGSYSMGIGAGVVVNADNNACLGVGWNQTFLGANIAMLLVGYENWADDSGYSTISGYYNHMDMVDSSLIVGWGNTLVCSDWNVAYTGYSLIAGSTNIATDVMQMLVSGTANVIEDSVDGAVIGRGLINSEDNHIVVGKFNAAPAVGATPVFTVANGTGTASNQRNNAVVVYNNGDVVIKKAQGDILMGEFGN